MALFKIFKGDSAGFAAKTTSTEGYAYFVEDTGKFYIDVGTGASTTWRRVLNADAADRFYTDKVIKFTGDDIWVHGATSESGSKISTDFSGETTIKLTVKNAAKVANSVNLTCTDVNGVSKINATFNGSSAASFALTPEKLFPLTTITKNINLNANSGGWVDLGIEGTAIPNNGSYIIQIYVNDGGTTGETLEHYDEYYTGTFSWYNGQTSWGGAENADEIVLHKAGLSSGGNNLYLRTVHTAAGYLKMQAAYYRTTGTIDTSSALTIKVRQLI